MLHILLLILKWIGIVLAVFLLLVLLLINLGLFVPFGTVQMHPVKMI